MSNLDQYCRLCLSYDRVLVSLFDSDEDDSNSPLYTKVIRCVPIKISNGDGLPVSLCQTCSSKITEFYWFREKCEFIDTALRKFLKQNKATLNDDLELKIKLIVQSSDPTLRTKKRKWKTLSCESSPRKDEKGCKQNRKKEEARFEKEDDDLLQCELPLFSPSPKSEEEADEEENKPGSRKARDRKHKQPEYMCEFCGRIFSRSNHLAQHEMTHTAEKPFQCSECNKSFWYKASLIGHIKQTHTGDVNYTCELCGKGFFKKTELSRHKPTHSNETPHKCPQCGLGFKITKTLKRHIRNVHNAQRSHTCHTCGKSFTQLQTLKVHLVLHSGVKPYVCSYCGKGFSQSAPLKTHIRIHTGERPYSCHACGVAFSTRSALTSHSLKHTGSLPYPCTRCSSTFRLRKDLVLHEQGHDDEESRLSRSGLMHLEAEHLSNKEHNQGDDHSTLTASDPLEEEEEQEQKQSLKSPVSQPQQVPASHTVRGPNLPVICQKQLPSAKLSSPEQTVTDDVLQPSSRTDVICPDQNHISPQLVIENNHLDTELSYLSEAPSIRNVRRPKPPVPLQKLHLPAKPSSPEQTVTDCLLHVSFKGDVLFPKEENLQDTVPISLSQVTSIRNVRRSKASVPHQKRQLPAKSSSSEQTVSDIVLQPSSKTDLVLSNQNHFSQVKKEVNHENTDPSSLAQSHLCLSPQSSLSSNKNN